jgi:ABC-2 type transport system permease protein
MDDIRKVLLVARREYLAYVGAWGFWISLMTTPLLIVALIFAPILLRRTEPVRVMTIVAERPIQAEAIRAAFEKPQREEQRDALWKQAFEAAPKKAEVALAAFDGAPELEKAIAAGSAALGEDARRVRLPPLRYRFVAPPARDGQGLAPFLSGARTIDGAALFAAFVVAGAGKDMKLDYLSTNLTDNEPVQTARRALSGVMRAEVLAGRGLGPRDIETIDALSPAFAQRDPRARTGSAVTAADRAPFLAAAFLTLLLWGAVIGVANMLLSGVIEEKSNKILDALLTSVTPLQILIGKLLGVAAVSATLFAVWALFGMGGVSATSGMAASAAGAALSPALGFTFVACFAAGYLLYGALYLGIGALCDNIQEAQSLLGPMVLVLSAPLLLLGPAFANPRAPIIEAASWIPLFSPFVLLMRAPAGLTFGEIAGPLLVLVLTLFAVLALSARLFRAGLSHELSFSTLRTKLFRR